VDAVKAPGILTRHPELRWLASVVLVAAAIVAVTSYVSGAFRDDDSALAVTGPEQLVSEVRSPHIGGYSGTILAKVDLGLPPSLLAALGKELPYGGSLLNHSHTIRYWYANEQQQRVAILGQDDEQDVFRDGTDMVFWDSDTRTYEKHVVASGQNGLPLSAGPPAVLTPPELAEEILAIPNNARTTTLRSGDQVVPGRPTYELVVVPSSPRSLIGSVVIEIDGKQAVPLRVQVFARGETEPAIDLEFTSINFAPPQDRNFSFTPPPGATPRPSSVLPTDAIRAVGTDWLRLVSYQTTSPIADLIARTFGPGMRAVKGKWGSGRIYSAGLVSVLVTKQARLLAGAVEPSVLYAAARKR
jgi:outer membrane lipoprotein-sorting protein